MRQHFQGSLCIHSRINQSTCQVRKGCSSTLRYHHSRRICLVGSSNMHSRLFLHCTCQGSTLCTLQLLWLNTYQLRTSGTWSLMWHPWHPKTCQPRNQSMSRQMSCPKTCQLRNPSTPRMPLLRTCLQCTRCTWSLRGHRCWRKTCRRRTGCTRHRPSRLKTCRPRTQRKKTRPCCLNTCPRNNWNTLQLTPR